MSQPVLHKILIGALFLSLSIVGIMLFFTGTVNQYGLTDYNDSNLQKLDGVFDDINDATNSTREKLLNLQTQQGDQNKLDLFFTQAYDGAKTISASISGLFIITDVAISESTPGLGNFSGTLKSYIWLILIVVFAIGLLMYFIIGKERV